MAIKYLDAKRIRCLSSDTKPTNVSAGTIAELTDTYKYNWFDGTNWYPLPLRAVVAGGGQSDNVSGNVICYFSISTLGNATTFGAVLTQRRAGIASGQCNNDTRAVFACGDHLVTQNVMDYVTIATTGTCTDFGDYSAGCNVMGMVSQKNSDGRAVGGGGYIYPSGSSTNVMSYFNIGTTGNTSDFGDLTSSRYSIGGLSNATRGLFAGGQEGGGRTDVIDYITIASAGNATNFGTLFQTQTSVGGVANETRGIFCGGYGSTDTMEYVTIASTGNATDFGNLSDGANHISGVADSTRGCICGGSEVGNDMNTEIQYVTIATLGNTTDFGDLVIGNKAAGTGAA